MMRYAALAVLLLASSVSAHTRIWSAWVNGVDQGDGRGSYIRSPPTNDPTKDMTSAAMACNANPKAVPNFVKANAGDRIDLEWYHDNRGDDIVDASHRGPMLTYIAAYTDGDGTGPIWTKIQQDGYDATTNTWAADRLIANRGKQELTLPADLKAGRYLVRQELIALHEADARFSANAARGAQFYPSCLQFDIAGPGAAVPDQAFDLQRGYAEADPGISFNVYAAFDSYQIPGPPVWTGPAADSPVLIPAPSETELPAPSTTAPLPSPTTTAPPRSSTTVPASSAAASATDTSTVTDPVASAAPSKPACNRRRRRRAAPL